MIMWMLMIMFLVVIMKMVMIMRMKMIISVACGGPSVAESIDKPCRAFSDELERQLLWFAPAT